MSDETAQISTEQQTAPVRVVGRPFPKGVSGNPRGRPKGHKAFLRELIGENGEEGYRLIWQIARGELSYQKLARDPAPGEDVTSASLIPLVTVVPTIRERKDAAEFLVEQLNGKSVSTVEMHASVEVGRTFDLSRLDDAGLADLDAKLGIAFTGEVIDADFAPAPGLLPDGWGEGAPLALPEGSVLQDTLPKVFPVDAETAFASEYEGLT